MAILKGQAARDYLKKNPNASYKQISGGQSKVVQPDQGFFGNLVRETIRPFYDLARGSYEVANAATGNQVKSSLSKEERENPLAFAGKTAAGIGSYAVPGVGKGLVRAATQGLASGGLQGLAQQEVGKDFDINKVINSAGTGAVIGGGIGLASKGLSAAAKRLPKIGSNLVDDATVLGARSKGIKMNSATKTPRSTLLKDVGNLDEIVKDSGGKGVNLNNIEKAYQKNAQSLRSAVQKSRLKANLTDIEGNAAQKFRLEGGDLADPVFTERVKMIKGRIGDQPSVAQLLDEKFKLQSEMSGIYNKQASGFRLEPSEKATLALHDSIDEIIKQVPEAKDALSKLTTINQYRPQLTGQANKGGSVQIGGTNIPAFGIPEKIAGAGASVGKGVGALLQSPRIQNLGKVINQPAVVRTAVLGTLISSRAASDPELGLELETAQELTGEVPDYATSLLDANDVQAQRIQLFNEYRASVPNAKLSDAVAYANFVLPASAKLSAADQKVIRSTLTARNNLESLKKLINENQSYFNPISGQPIFNTLGSLTGDATRARLQTSLGAIMQNILKNLEGGKLTDKDREYYLSEVAPSLVDSPERAIARIEQLEQLVQNDEDVARQIAGTGGLNLNIQQ